jgi:hypothetical protein
MLSRFSALLADSNATQVREEKPSRISTVRYLQFQFVPSLLILNSTTYPKAPASHWKAHLTCLPAAPSFHDDSPGDVHGDCESCGRFRFCPSHTPSSLLPTHLLSFRFFLGFLLELRLHYHQSLNWRPEPRSWGQCRTRQTRDICCISDHISSSSCLAQKFEESVVGHLSTAPYFIPHHHPSHPHIFHPGILGLSCLQDRNHVVILASPLDSVPSSSSYSAVGPANIAASTYLSWLRSPPWIWL